MALPLGSVPQLGVGPQDGFEAWAVVPLMFGAPLMFLPSGGASMGAMARTVYHVAASLDGYLTEPRPAAGLRAAGSATDVGDGGDWLSIVDPASVGAIVMGAQTYRTFLEENPAAWAFGTIPAWIFTHHEFPGIPGADITFVRGDVAEFHPDIAHDAGIKDIGLIGGGNLAAQFLDSGLLDEVVLTLVPVVLGGGRPMLPVSNATDFAVLGGSRSHGPGLVELHYSFEH